LMFGGLPDDPRKTGAFRFTDESQRHPAQMRRAIDDLVHRRN
jgi:hypothetical protein